MLLLITLINLLRGLAPPPCHCVTAGASLVVDNTFTPLAVTPTSWGADVVVHSLTKFVSGGVGLLPAAACCYKPQLTIQLTTAK